MTDAELEKMAEQATRHPTDGSWTTNPQDAFVAGYKKAREWVSVDTPPGKDCRVLAFPNTVGQVGTALYWVADKMWQDLEDHTEPWKPKFWCELPAKPEGME